MKILITGGHITPALAVLEELKKYPDIKVVFVGRRYTSDVNSNPSFEYQEIAKHNIPFIDLKTGRLTRSFSLQSLLHLVKIPSGFVMAYRIIKREKPDCVLSFGGYIGLPVGLAGHLFRIPVFIHEQTIKPGITNKTLGLFAKKIFVAFPESVNSFKKSKAVVTGNPIRQAIFTIDVNSLKIPSKNDKKVMYVTGGSQGSHSLNIHIENILKNLLDRFIVIHQCGDNIYRDFQRLSESAQSGYIVRKHFFDNEIGFIFDQADMVVSRVGANTITELIALEKPAVLIPLPISAEGEQKNQALWLKDVGVAEVHFQNRPALELLEKIEKVAFNIDEYKKNFKEIADFYKKDAAKIIVDLIRHDIERDIGKSKK